MFQAARDGVGTRRQFVEREALHNAFSLPGSSLALTDHARAASKVSKVSTRLID